MSKITEIDDEIAQKMLKVEEFGEKGDADNSFKALEEVEELKKKKIELEVRFLLKLIIFKLILNCFNNFIASL